MCMRVCVRAFMHSCVTLAPFGSLWPAFTLTVHINALYNESVHRKEQHTTYDSVKIATLLPLEIFEVWQLFCLFMKLGSLRGVATVRRRAVHCVRTRAFVYFIFQLTKNADSDGIENSMQYRSPNAIPDQTWCIILSFDWTRAINWIQWGTMQQNMSLDGATISVHRGEHQFIAVIPKLELPRCTDTPHDTSWHQHSVYLFFSWHFGCSTSWLLFYF